MKKLIATLLLLIGCAAEVETDEAEVDEIQQLSSSTTHPDIVYVTVPALTGWQPVTSQLSHVSGSCNNTGCTHGYQGSAPFYESTTTYPNDCVQIPGDNRGMWCQDGHGPDHRVWVNCPSAPTPSAWATVVNSPYAFEGWSAWTPWWFVSAVPSYVQAAPVTVSGGAGLVRVDCKYSVGGSSTLVIQHL